MIIASIVVASALSSFLDRATCGSCNEGVQVSYCTTPSFKVLILNPCSDIVSVSGSASGRAAATYMVTTYQQLDACYPHDPFLDGSYMESGFSSPLGEDSAVIIDDRLSIGASASAFIECEPSFFFVADLDCDTQNGANRMEGASTGGYEFNGSVQRAFDGVAIGAGASIDCSVAGFDSHVVVDLIAPLEFSADLRVDVESVYMPYDECKESGGLGGRGAIIDPLAPKFAGEQFKMTVSNLSTNESFDAGGVVGIDLSTGLPVVLGEFDGAGISVDVQSNVATVVGEVEVGHLFSDSGEFVISTITRNFGAVAGDFNGDGDATLGDYETVDDAYPSVVGDSNYWASVDLDLDGDVDIDDATEADAILLAVVGAQVCDADLNGDDVLNFFDVNLFLSYYGSSDPQADWNGDSAVNFFDVTAYLAEYNAGCP